MSWIVTYTGREVDPFTMTAEDVDLMDIAHSLSQQCRFMGHSQVPWSVARHSLLVHDIVLFDLAGTPRDLFAALMHDACEAYCHDIATPIKRRLEGYHGLEGQTWLAVCSAFGLSSQLTEKVRAADLMALRYEREFLLPRLPTSRPWPILERVLLPSPLSTVGYGQSNIVWDDPVAVRARFFELASTYLTHSRVGY